MSPDLIHGNVPIPTTPPLRPYPVRLQGGSARDCEAVTVYDHAIVGGRCIVRSAHGEGYWHIAAGSAAPADSDGVLVAIFEPHPNASFTFPPR